MNSNQIKYNSDGEIEYEGDIKDGLKEGKGIYYWTSGSRYEGDWKNNEPNGKGIKYFANGERYEGDYEGDFMHYGG